MNERLLSDVCTCMDDSEWCMSSYKNPAIIPLFQSRVALVENLWKPPKSTEFSSLLGAPPHSSLPYLLLVPKQQKSNYPSFSTLLLSDITRYSLSSLARTSNPSYLHLKYDLFLGNIAISSSRKYLNAILTCFIASLC